MVDFLLLLYHVKGPSSFSSINALMLMLWQVHLHWVDRTELGGKEGKREIEEVCRLELGITTSRSKVVGGRCIPERLPQP